MTESFKTYSFTDTEQKLQQLWQNSNIYAWQQDETRESSFIIDTPPPTVSGALHIGHVFSYTQTDFIARFQRMMGKNVFYPIGFDDNGLPTERLVEKQKNIRGADLPREDFIKICQSVVTTAEADFANLFKRLALSVDWSQVYQTISEHSRALSQLSFIDLYNKGQIYRAIQPILWDTVDQTALAQADIEDREKQSVMYDIIFKTENGQELKIATSRPELLPACVAVFYNPLDPRYQHLAGKYAITPLFKVKVPFIADSLVNIEKATGLVMCCTFGDTTDLLWWKTHKLPLRIIIGKDGRFIDLNFQDISLDSKQADDFFEQLINLKIKEARSKIVELLLSAEFITNQQNITQTVKCAERSGAPLEILTSAQWFIKTIEHKDKLLERSAELNWYPKSMKIKLDTWINNLNWDWCISRQRYFGVAFPVWYSKRVGEEGKILFAAADQLPVDPLQSLPAGYHAHEVEADSDVMDTWATSSITPQLNSHGITDEYYLDNKRHAKLYPADLRPQAHEIIRTWTFTTILKAHLHSNQLPWHNIMISGWCLAEDKTKMSKSKGNIIAPEQLLNEYGTDVIRYWASTVKLGNDTAYSADIMKNGKRLTNKLWNAAKLITINISKINKDDLVINDSNIRNNISHNVDIWLIDKLNDVITRATEQLQQFEYCNARQIIEDFFWRDFCDNYLEICKTRSYNNIDTDSTGQRSALHTMYIALVTILKLLAPFMPYICDEIYQNLCSDNCSIHQRGSWPQIIPTQSLIKHNQFLQQVDILIIILDLVRKAKAEKNLSIKTPISLIEIRTDIDIAVDIISDLKNVIAAQKVTFVEDFSEQNHVIEQANMAINLFY